MSATDPSTEYEALMHVVDRLALRFPGVSEETLRDLVAAEFVRFDGAAVRDFVPVLVEGTVLRELRQRTRPPSPGAVSSFP